MLNKLWKTLSALESSDVDFCILVLVCVTIVISGIYFIAV